MRAKESERADGDDQPAKLLTYEAILAPLDQNLIRANPAPRRSNAPEV
jgi:hypothetical protein